MPVFGSESAAMGSGHVYGHFVIWPHRSLSDSDMRRILLVITVTGGLLDLAMFIQFGWIVGAAILVDLFFVGVALLASQRQRDARETILVTSTGIRIERHSSGCKLLSSVGLPLYPLTLRCTSDPVRGSHVELVSAQHRMRIGEMLLPHERRTFSDALLEALQQAGAAPATHHDNLSASGRGPLIPRTTSH